MRFWGSGRGLSNGLRPGAADPVFLRAVSVHVLQRHRPACTYQHAPTSMHARTVARLCGARVRLGGSELRPNGSKLRTASRPGDNVSAAAGKCRQEWGEKARAEGAGTAVSEPVTKTSSGPGATGQARPGRGHAKGRAPPRPPKRPSAVAGRAQKYQKWSEKARAEGAGTAVSEPVTKTSRGPGATGPNQPRHGPPKSTKNGAKRRARRVPEAQFRNPSGRLATAQERQEREAQARTR